MTEYEVYDLTTRRVIDGGYLTRAAAERAAYELAVGTGRKYSVRFAKRA
jgi:hypothetical protein